MKRYLIPITFLLVSVPSSAQETPNQPGQIKWEFATGSAVRSSPALGTNGIVYFGSLDDTVYALDSTTGLKKWDFSAGGYVSSSPAVLADGTILVPSGIFNGRLFALEPTTGAKKWEASFNRSLQSSPAAGPDGTIYVGSEDYKFYALHGTSGLAQSPWPKYRRDPQSAASQASPGAPLILWQSSDQLVRSGDDATIGVYAGGSWPLDYQWQRDGQPIPGATDSTLTLSADQLNEPRRYFVTVSNLQGSVRSLDIVVTPGYPLSVASAGPGKAEKTPNLEVYPRNASVEIKAIPADGRTFVGWRGTVSGQEIRWFSSWTGITRSQRSSAPLPVKSCGDSKREAWLVLQQLSETMGQSTSAPTTEHCMGSIA